MKVMIFTRRRLAVLTSCLAAGLLVAVLAAQGLSVVTAASRKLLPVYSVETAEKKACLTFDAAWGRGYAGADCGAGQISGKGNLFRGGRVGG